MSKGVYYRQCRLRKNHENKEYSEQVSYIPEPFCVKGKVLKLRDAKNTWEDGWKVMEVSAHRRLDEDMPDIHKEIRGHRKATGDSL